MIDCVLATNKNTDDLYRVFLPELKQAKTKRAQYTVEKKKGQLKFSIKATDIKSFKAFVSSIINIIETYNKISNLKNDRNQQ